MSDRVTWKWIETALFPLVVTEARQAGVNTDGWALDSRMGPGQSLVKLNSEKGVATVFQRFSTPREAELVLQGMRIAWSVIPTA